MGSEIGPAAVTTAQALADAHGAANHAGVDIYSISEPAELDRLRGLTADIWGAEVVPPRNLLRGLALGGACMLLAVHGERPVGFALGWLGWNPPRRGTRGEPSGGVGVHLHSHQVGVIDDRRGTGIGLALKLAQRSLALEQGVTRMRWTFDPLQATNARFNLLRLGAVVVDFLPHCYGDRTDRFNTGDTTDRVEVDWRLDTPTHREPVEARADDSVLVIPDHWTAWRSQHPDEAAELRHTHGVALQAAVLEHRLRGWGRDPHRPETSGWVIAPPDAATST